MPKVHVIRQGSGLLHNEKFIKEMTNLFIFIKRENNTLKNKKKLILTYKYFPKRFSVKPNTPNSYYSLFPHNTYPNIILLFGERIHLTSFVED